MMTEKEILQLASMTNKKRKYYVKNKIKIPKDAEITSFSYGTIIYLTHLGQNGSIVSECCPTLTVGCNFGVIIYEEKNFS